jgi:hypothetical protein
VIVRKSFIYSLSDNCYEKLPEDSCGVIGEIDFLTLQSRALDALRYLTFALVIIMMAVEGQLGSWIIYC